MTKILKKLWKKVSKFWTLKQDDNKYCTPDEEVFVLNYTKLKESLAILRLEEQIEEKKKSIYELQKRDNEDVKSVKKIIDGKEQKTLEELKEECDIVVMKTKIRQKRIELYNLEDPEIKDFDNLTSRIK